MASAYILHLLLIRKLRFITHAEMKRRFLLHVSSLLSLDDLSQFSSTMKKHLNPLVIDSISNYKKHGYSVVVSSAAPNLYIDIIIAKLCPFIDYVISTPTPDAPSNKEWIENIGENKKYKTMSFLKKKNLTFSVFYTDHYDDLPLLMMEKEKNYLVNPSSKTKFVLDAEHIEYKMIL